jgi:hypothetical protein
MENPLPARLEPASSNGEPARLQSRVAPPRKADIGWTRRVGHGDFFETFSRPFHPNSLANLSYLTNSGKNSEVCCSFLEMFGTPDGRLSKDFASFSDEMVGRRRLRAPSPIAGKAYIQRASPRAGPVRAGERCRWGLAIAWRLQPALDFRCSPLPAGEEGELLEQMHVLLVLEQRAVQGRDQLLRLFLPQRLGRNVLIEQKLQPVQQL